MPTAKEPLITINGKQYDPSTLPESVKNLLTIYQIWQADREAAVKAVSDARIVLAKNEAAIRDLSAEIISLIETK